MLRKFLIAVTFATLLLTSQPAVAEIPIDWSRVQRVSSKTELAQYMERQQKAGDTIIPVILTNGLKVELGEFITLCPSSVVSQRTLANDGQTIRVIYTLMSYPGTKVANAYLSGDTTWLNAEEKQLYDAAVAVINNAKRRKGVINQEVCLYEEIMNRTTYLSGDMNNQPRFCTAYGVLLDGKANCQGYTDAFYMLGRMMGWNVGRVNGSAGGGGHAWNTVELNGKTYFVDATLDDNAIGFGGFRSFNSYVYFNAPAEIMQETHSWDRSLEPANLQPSVDGLYSYCALDSNLLRANSAEAGMKLLAKKLVTEKKKYVSVMVPFDERYSVKNIRQALNFINGELVQTYKARLQTYLWCRNYGKYLFLTVAVP